jgi:hypothetical protein
MSWVGSCFLKQKNMYHGYVAFFFQNKMKNGYGFFSHPTKKIKNKKDG